MNSRYQRMIVNEVNNELGNSKRMIGYRLTSETIMIYFDLNYVSFTDLEDILCNICSDLGLQYDLQYSGNTEALVYIREII